MELFVELEETLEKCIAREDLAGARQACNDMATQIHSVPDQRQRYEASRKLNMAREKVNGLAAKAFNNGGEQSLDGNGMAVNQQ